MAFIRVNAAGGIQAYVNTDNILTVLSPPLDILDNTKKGCTILWGNGQKFSTLETFDEVCSTIDKATAPLKTTTHTVGDTSVTTAEPLPSSPYPGIHAAPDHLPLSGFFDIPWPTQAHTNRGVETGKFPTLAQTQAAWMNARHGEAKE